MDATISPPSPRSRRPWHIGSWTFVVLGLLMAGMVLQACSDNNGTTGPTFACREGTAEARNARSLAACTASPAPVVGDAVGGPLGTLFVGVTINPATIDIGRRASVLTIVTNANGIAVAGRPVQLTAAGGNLDATSGVTDENGVFATTMVVPCGTVAGTGTVTAIVQGVTGTGTFTQVTPPTNDPCL